MKRVNWILFLLMALILSAQFASAQVWPSSTPGVISESAISKALSTIMRDMGFSSNTLPIDGNLWILFFTNIPEGYKMSNKIAYGVCDVGKTGCSFNFLSFEGYQTKQKVLVDMNNNGGITLGSNSQDYIYSMIGMGNIRSSKNYGDGPATFKFVSSPSARSFNSEWHIERIAKMKEKVTINDYGICDKSSRKNQCLTYFAMALGKIDGCTGISDAALKADCIAKVAIETRNRKICDEFGANTAGKKACYEKFDATEYGASIGVEKSDVPATALPALTLPAVKTSTQTAQSEGMQTPTTGLQQGSEKKEVKIEVEKGDLWVFFVHDIPNENSADVHNKIAYGTCSHHANEENDCSFKLEYFIKGKGNITVNFKAIIDKNETKMDILPSSLLINDSKTIPSSKFKFDGFNSKVARNKLFKNTIDYADGGIIIQVGDLPEFKARWHAEKIGKLEKGMPRNSEICKSIGKGPDFISDIIPMVKSRKDRCYSYFARASSADICKEIVNQPVRVMDCYTFAAIENDKISLCDNLKDLNKDICYRRYSVAKNNPKVCESIVSTKNDEKELCYALAVKAESDLDLLKNVNNIYFKDRSFVNLAVNTKNHEFCKNISDEDINWKIGCYFKIALLKGDDAVCKEMSSIKDVKDIKEKIADCVKVTNKKAEISKVLDSSYFPPAIK